MTEKEEENKEETPIEEKRIKPSVIRRRAARKKPAAAAKKAAEPEAAESEAEAAPAAPAAEEGAAPKPSKPVKTEAEAVPAAPAAPEGGGPAAGAVERAAAKEPRSAKKAAAKGRGAASKKDAAAKKAAARKLREKSPAKILEEIRAEETAEVVEEQAASGPEAPKQTPKREVKVFTHEPQLKRFYPSKRPARKGKHFRSRGPRQNKVHASASRPLKKTEITTPKAAKMVVRIEDAISVSDLSQRIGVKAGEIIKKLMGLGIMATVNQFIDIDAVTLIAQDYGFDIENVALSEETLMQPAEGAGGGRVEPRAPVVTVMGHVDHGKTSLLDAIRETNVAEGESGGITQHIGAYHVHLDKGDVTFLDTPGHEAFTAMRARGAKATDIVVLVVAADDGVMPQTVEAINHARAAEVPIIVAVNKIDLPQANPEKIRTELGNYGLVPEAWGGDTIFVDVSAKKGENIKELLELILLQSEVLELKAVRDAPARGIVVEGRLHKGRGPVATVLIQSGSLKVGDAVVSGVHHGRVRAMISDWGRRIDEAGPSLPVEILGLSGVPDAGETLTVVKDEATAKQIAALRERKMLEKGRGKMARVSLEDLYERITQGEAKELNLVLKADVQGSIEAVRETLSKLSTDAIRLNVIHGAVGGVNEGDVMLASASNAIVIGFNVRPEPSARALAERENVDLRFYSVIYNLVDEIRNAMEGMLEPVITEEVIGRAEIRDVFRITKVGPVAGCYVTEGKAARGAHARLIRDNVVIYDGKLASLKRFKDDVKEVASGYECGMMIEGYNDIKTGDVIELYMLKEEAAKL